MPYSTPEKLRAYRQRSDVLAKNREHARRWHERPDNRAKHIQKMKEWSALRRYGITYEQAAVMVEQQNGLCALCRTRSVSLELKTRGMWSAAIDHDHETGRVRGILCRTCNVGLGLLGDNLDGLMRAVEYLRKDN